MQISKLKGDASIAVLSLFTVILMGLCLEFVFFSQAYYEGSRGSAGRCYSFQSCSL
ncbi:hypothetical protein DE170_002049 [Clostridium acetobutylicum]|nr:hypothetical protein [Clostridium acetobutylicum]NYC94109.1 hypothetical protein [Clostridium acetobutylicum]